jgi:hypothetical protein
VWLKAVDVFFFEVGIMCPACFANAIFLAVSAGSAGGLAAMVIRRFGVKSAVDDQRSTNVSNGTEEEHHV